MCAFTRHISNREVLFEKNNNFNSIEKYNFKHCDSVEVTYYTKQKHVSGFIFKLNKIKGFIKGYGYRMNAQCKTIGYCTVCLIQNYGSEINLNDNKELNKKGKYIQVYPTKIMLIEKNIIEKYEIAQKEVDLILNEMSRLRIMGG